jgi:hypothetical protein
MNPAIDGGAYHNSALGFMQSPWLRMKFGSLPSAMDERISVATTEQLETWADRVLTAESLAAVFAD